MSNRLRIGEPLRVYPRDFRLPRQPSVHRVICWIGITAVLKRYRSRQRIAMLDSHLLKDMGVSFAEAEAEANKPFWRA